ncbi:MULTISPECIES: 3-methyl-2-oxobutanoate hydroxymethyltransferase [Bacillaceae]|uniref:3-methyl-2-oxobutanoate hydroxymethyltransferase n=1 Tax=Pseudobacillus wudalianchiensis TaxID=1743143 RepID=A0A1B9B9K3_9BACI|nr:MULTISPECIES: 3-methyl-2-oxobutanoate hydroxymethyltransferase [Bacillus]KMY54592.1 3-methyl-2-oxobutanoate hydroxymethyltransferase [Bacillus sp. FJAT-27231]OCA92774.1 3-methyl-2-oxobutanoate hydroxymethyltransferase [Bacillus wudalianchiensis]
MKQTSDFIKMKENGEKIAMITAYDYPSAKLSEEGGADIILVGDSLGMVVLGYESTVPVTLADMIHHTKAVKRGAKETFIVTDLPFMSYHISREETMRAARALMQEAGAHAVKIEGGEEAVEAVRDLTLAGVPTVAHLGLTPQSVGVLGGYKVQGKTAEAAKKLLLDAKKLEEAGAFMAVLECVPYQIAAQVAGALTIPVIGIGAGKETDGQVLVYHDLIRYGVSRTPKFVKSYANVNEEIIPAVSAYVAEVKEGAFPAQEHSFTMKEEELEALYGGARS